MPTICVNIEIHPIFPLFDGEMFDGYVGLYRILFRRKKHMHDVPSVGPNLLNYLKQQQFVCQCFHAIQLDYITAQM